jgi:hypothetical protein
MRAMQTASLCCVILAAACAGDAGPAPTATVIESSPGELDTSLDAADDLTIRVHYSDGDGDLGGGFAEVADCRAADLVTRLQLPPIASMEAVDEGVPIEGELELRVSDVGLVAPDAQAPPTCVDLGIDAMPSADQTIFCVVLEDAAGNRGEGDCTSPVTVR